MNLRDLIGVLGHELRTPLAAILGYQELLADGIYGDLDERKQEPVDRIHQSAQQLLHLIDGLQELAVPGTVAPEDWIDTDTAELITQLLATARPFAAGRSVILEAPTNGSATRIRIPLQRFLRAADLTLVAAIKASSGKTLPMSLLTDNGTSIFRIDGCSLDPEHDRPGTSHAVLDNANTISAAQLRLEMAAATLRAVGGEVVLRREGEGTRVELRLPTQA